LNRDTGERELVLMRWGLIPFSFWAKDPSIGLRTINAKAETITTAPAFREEIKFRRCLVPSDLFYEWVRPESRPDDCPAWSRDRTCRPIGSTLGGQAVQQRTVEKPSDNVTAAARLLSKP
jgi:putative SOS response-associated peptidase YedK